MGGIGSSSGAGAVKHAEERVRVLKTRFAQARKGTAERANINKLLVQAENALIDARAALYDK